jgi:RNA polymerase sigma-70 factor (ECF subfamily)
MKDAYFIALGLVGNQEDALDLSQEAFIKAYTNIESLNAQWGFFPWFYQILRNLCFSHLRRRKNRSGCSLDVLVEQPGHNSDCACPSTGLEKQELSTKLWEAIDRLDEKHREVIVLRHFQNLSYEQMSKALFCSVGTVTSRLYYARMKLKEILERQKGGL